MITTYLELKAAIQSYGKRGDVLSNIDDFIDLAEVDIWDELRIRDMEVRAIANAPMDDRFIALPEGFNQMRRLRLILTGDDQIDLDYVDPKNLRVYTTPGRPYEYTIGSQIELTRASDQPYTLEMKYWREMQPLGPTQETNVVLEQHPMIYLSGALKHYGLWAVNDIMAAKYQAVFDANVAKANRRARKGRYGPAPTKTTPGMVI